MARNASGIELIVPDWPAPSTVSAVSTTRRGGTSQGPYASLNLGTHVGDDGHAVQSNRRALIDELGLSDRPRWLNQVHGVEIVEAEGVYEAVSADGAIACTAGVACTVMTADCLPVLLCDRAGTRVAAVHGGWRGLVGGILEQALAIFSRHGIHADDLLAWLGPAIGRDHYEVGPDVEGALAEDDAAALTPNESGRWQLDLVGLARARLSAGGVRDIYGGNWCTYADPRFFSYRRDGVCGRQATLVWLNS